MKKGTNKEHNLKLCNWISLHVCIGGIKVLASLFVVGTCYSMNVLLPPKSVTGDCLGHWYQVRFRLHYFIYPQAGRASQISSY